MGVSPNPTHHPTYRLPAGSESGARGASDVIHEPGRGCALPAIFAAVVVAALLINALGLLR